MFYNDKLISRRTFGKFSFGAIVSHAVMETLFSQHALAKTVVPIVDHWVKQLNEFCSDMKTQQISQKVWQEYTEALFQQIELKELLQFIDFDRLTKQFEYPDLGVGTKYVKFPKLEGIPQKTVFTF